MKTVFTYLTNLIFPLIPESRGYAFKRRMLRLAGAKIGADVKISSSLKIFGSGQLVIGDNTWLGYQTVIVCSSKVEIGANVDIAPQVYIGTGTHIVDSTANHVAAKNISKDVIIGNGCWICTNATILPGVELGEKCVVAAGAVVNKSFYENKILLAGVPAIKKKTI